MAAEAAAGGHPAASARPLVVRPAVPADRSAVEDIVRAAYQPWIEVIGGLPAPLRADYPRR